MHRTHRKKNRHAQAPLWGVLCNSDLAVACGLFAFSSSPVFALCRLLIADGFDPDSPLILYRDDDVAIRIARIGKAAQLEVDGEGTGFRKIHHRQPGAASPARSNGHGGVSVP